MVNWYTKMVLKLLVFGLVVVAVVAEVSKKPNIIVIVADDMVSYLFVNF